MLSVCLIFHKFHSETIKNILLNNLYFSLVSPVASIVSINIFFRNEIYYNSLSQRSGNKQLTAYQEVNIGHHVKQNN